MKLKRFVTYLYEYKDGHKEKNVGFLRVDIRNKMVTVQVSIRNPELTNEQGNFYLIVRDENAYGISIGEIQMKEGQYQSAFSCSYQNLGESSYGFSDVVGVGIRYENGCYLASSWRDEEDEMIASGAFFEPNSSANMTEELHVKTSAVENLEEETNVLDEQIMAASVLEAPKIEEPIIDYEKFQDTYRKINLNEITTLPSNNWYYSNNSFLIHGFWNYGYLVLKETMENGKKKYLLGVPGIFEQPEMVMATYFGFPIFQALPPQVVEIEVGEACTSDWNEKNQKPQVGTFGCWFVDL